MKWMLIAVCLLSLPTWAAVDTTATVVVMKAKKSTSFERLTYPARVVSTVDAAITADFDGVILQVLKPLGSKVVRGETILKLEHSDPIYQYAPAAIVAPVSGYVGAIKAGPGTRVTRGQLLATVTDPSKSKISIELAASDLPLVKKGQNAEFKMAGLDQPIEVEVTGVSPFVDPASGTATCELNRVSRAKNGKASLLVPGQVGQVWIKANEREAFQVPEHAVYYKGQESYLRLVTDGKVKKVAVKLGAKRSGQVEILSGLSGGDQIVMRSSGFLADDEKVVVQGQVDSQGKTVQ